MYSKVHKKAHGVKIRFEENEFRNIGERNISWRKRTIPFGRLHDLRARARARVILRSRRIYAKVTEFGVLIVMIPFLKRHGCSIYNSVYIYILGQLFLFRFGDRLLVYLAREGIEREAPRPCRKRIEKLYRSANKGGKDAERENGVNIAQIIRDL